MTAPEPKYSLIIERDAPGTDFAYDVVLAAVDEEGQALGLPLLLVSFRSGVPAITESNFDPAYAQAAGFVVADMNPVGLHGCEGAHCVFPINQRR
jgi:hypothetical protein